MLAAKAQVLLFFAVDKAKFSQKEQTQCFPAILWDAGLPGHSKTTHQVDVRCMWETVGLHLLRWSLRWHWNWARWFWALTWFLVSLDIVWSGQLFLFLVPMRKASEWRCWRTVANRFSYFWIGSRISMWNVVDQLREALTTLDFERRDYLNTCRTFASMELFDYFNALENVSLDIL